MLRSLMLEVAVVAVITAACLVFAVVVGGPITGPLKALVVGLLIGAVIHLGFEFLGGNAYYCKYGAACLQN